eukprot:jgi/Mesen1/3834/ME000207S02840
MTGVSFASTRRRTRATIGSSSGSGSGTRPAAAAAAVSGDRTASYARPGGGAQCCARGGPSRDTCRAAGGQGVHATAANDSSISSGGARVTLPRPDAAAMHEQEEEEEEAEEVAATLSPVLSALALFEQKVSSLLSGLEQHQEEEEEGDKVGAGAEGAKKGSIFGAMALITGTTVGAGILALPAVTAPAGFFPSATVLCSVWAFLVVEALLLAEVNISLLQRRQLSSSQPPSPSPSPSPSLSCSPSPSLSRSPSSSSFTSPCTDAHLQSTSPTPPAFFQAQGGLGLRTVDLRSHQAQHQQLGADLDAFSPIQSQPAASPSNSEPTSKSKQSTLEAGSIQDAETTPAALRLAPPPGAHSDVISLRTMAEESLGPIGGATATLTYLFLSYTLLVAYIAKSADVISFASGGTPAWLSGGVFTLGLGGVLFKGGTHATDVLNRVLTGCLLGLFGVIVLGGASMADWVELGRADWEAVPQVVPVVFLSLVYHDLIPVLCSYLGGDLKRVRAAIVLGSAVPLGMFLSWDAVALCLAHTSGGEDPLHTLMRLGGPAQACVIGAFSLLALSTSFIGTVLGLSEFLLEQFGNLSSGAGGDNVTKTTTTTTPMWPMVTRASSMREWIEGRWRKLLKGEESVRGLAFVLILAPALAVAATTPDAFYTATDVATPKSQEESSWTFPGGSAVLAGVGACASAVIVGQVLLDSTLVPPIGPPEVVLAANDAEASNDGTTDVVGAPLEAPHVVG